MVQTCVDLAMEELARLQNEQALTSAMKDEILKIQAELRFLKMFFLSLAKSGPVGKDVHVKSAITALKSALEVAQKGLYTAGLEAIRKRLGRKWRLLTSGLLEKVQQFKSAITKNCKSLFDCSWGSKKSYASDEILKLMDCLLDNLKVLSNPENEMIDSVKIQIEALEGKLWFSRDLVNFTAKSCIDHEKLEDFLSHIQAWACTSAWISFVSWSNPTGKDMEARLNVMLSDLLKKIQPCSSPQVLRMYLGVLTASKSSSSDSIRVGEIVTSFVDFLLQYLVISKSDCFEILQEGLMFLMTFLIDPPRVCPEEGKLILARVDTVVTEAASLFCPLSLTEMDEDLANDRNALLSDFLERVKMVKQEVRERFVQIPSSLEFKFLRTNGIRYIDFILENLKKLLQFKVNLIPLEKQKVLTIQRELEYLLPNLNKVIETQQNEIWSRITDLAYQAEHAIDLCSITDSPIWYNVTCLSLVIEEIQLIKTEVENIQDEHMNNIGPLTTGLDSKHAFTTQHTTSRIEEVVVGFEDEAKSVINQLTRGSTRLEIISIVGMPGQGKTTLAKKVYNDPSVQFHFHQRAWCCISQVYRYRDVLLDLSSKMVDLTTHNTSEMVDEELADLLRKCLLGQKYLIVMDDIWDLRAWYDLKGALPDKKVGSRILFTSRIHNLAWQDELDCIFHPLRQFSDEESWDLLHEKIFHKDGCPEDLLQVGKEIAKHCKGLPLSIVLVAGLLARRKNDLEWWKEIARSLTLRLPSDGCMDILELSYNNLPYYLKPCFLYFGAFSEDEQINVQKLTRLWVAEGFITRTEMKSSEDLAMEYLIDLISRSLVIVTQRSSKGSIKGCCVHDLLRDMCLTKAKEENFLQLISDVQSDSFDPIKHNYYRVCIHGRAMSHLRPGPIHSSVRSLLSDHCSRGPPYYSTSIFRTFRLLKVLYLKNFLLGSFQEITLVVHLRYLAISGDFWSIPPSIANLWNLETLILDGNAIGGVHLPDAIWKIQSLKHLYVQKLAYLDLGGNEFDECPMLDNLSLVVLVDTEMLHRRLPQLRKLSCIIRESMDCYTKCYNFPSFICFSGLESLNVNYGGYVFNIGNAFCDINCRQLPALNFPESLRKLTLSKFYLSKSAISIIAQLSNLEVLKLRKMGFEKSNWFVRDGQFMNLKFLEVSSSEIEEWNASTDPFPILEQLVLADCIKLRGIPSSFANICSLKIIKLRKCSPEVDCSAQKVLEEQQEWGNNDLKVVYF